MSTAAPVTRSLTATASVSSVPYVPPTPHAKRALLVYSACMRARGFNLHGPKFGPGQQLFNPIGINTRSHSFLAAVAKCSPVLKGTL